MAQEDGVTVAAQLAKLQDALLEGRISDEIYQRLKKDLLSAVTLPKSPRRKNDAAKLNVQAPKVSRLEPERYVDPIEAFGERVMQLLPPEERTLENAERLGKMFGGLAGFMTGYAFIESLKQGGVGAVYPLSKLMDLASIFMGRRG